MDERADVVLPALAPAIWVNVAIGCPALLCGYALVRGHSRASMLMAAAEAESKYLPSLTSVSAEQSIPRECSICRNVRMHHSELAIDCSHI